MTDSLNTTTYGVEISVFDGLEIGRIVLFYPFFLFLERD